jgi:hypothetical protein
MTYLHRLASRISRLRPFSFSAILLAAACAKGDKVDFLSPNPNPTSNTPALHDIRVEPQIASVRTGAETQFTVTGYSASGQVVPVTVDWTATGGSIWPDGRFVGDATGNFSVTARVRNQNSIADSARVNVWENGNEIVEVLVYPDSAVVEAGDTLQANAVLRLANGDLAPNAAVEWSASNNASIDEDGRFTSDATGAFTVSAQAVNGLRASTPVFVRPRDRLLRSIQLNPPAASLASGESVPFAAFANWSDGTTGLAEVAWSASGGTISNAGVYTAGSRAGQYAVVARQRNGPIADTALITIRPPLVASVTLSPKSVTLEPGAIQQFTAQALLSDASSQLVPVTWQATSGSIDGSGLFTAGAAVGSFKVIVRVVGSSVADTAQVTVQQSPATITQLLLNPSTATVPQGGTRQFSVTATWSDGTTSVPVVSWTATGGTISPGGLYTGGSIPGAYRVIATSAGGTADTSAVTVTAPVLTQIVVSPPLSTLLPSQTVQFSALGSYSDGSAGSPPVSWSASGGTISAAGLYTAGGSPGTYAVIATAQGSSLSDTGFVTIGAAPVTLTSLLLTPASVALAPGAGLEFHVIGTYSDGSTGKPAVTYSVTGGTMVSANRYVAGSLSGNYRVIAAEVGGTHADTSAVLITSPVSLTSLALAPKPVVLPTGGAMQFSVNATWSNGTRTLPPLTWSATGGTVSPTGLYSAGTTGGSYRVVAAQTGGTKADTAAVTISSVAPPTLTALAISPKTASLAVGGTRQFSISATWSDGSTTAPALTWTATGGTVSASGLYTAGPTAGTYRVIATQQGGTRADTATVTLTSGAAPTLTAVVVTPSATTVLVGGTQQFAAQGQYSDGSTGSVPVTWSATGGTVSTTGLYSAGMTTGTYRVIATQQGGTKADTSAVTLSAPLPPPPGGLYPNEPAGMVWNNTRSFNAKVENGWGDRGDPAFSIVSDPTAPVSPSNIGQAVYSPGLPSGSGPISTSIVLPAGIRTLYVTYWMKMSPNWTAMSQATKVIFFHIGGSTGSARVYSALRGTPTMGAEIDFQGMGTTGTGTNQAISWNGYPNQNTASSVVTRGQWVKWEIVLVANTPGQFDGTADWWMNGVRVGHYTGIGFSGATETGVKNVWQAVDWNPTWGGAGVTPPANQYMWMDHFYVSGKP